MKILASILMLIAGIVLILFFSAEYDKSSGNRSRREAKAEFDARKAWVDNQKKLSPDRIRAFKNKYKNLKVPPAKSP